jgi:hypothetical protein
LQRNRGFAGAGLAFDKEDVLPRKTARQDIVQSRNSALAFPAMGSAKIHDTPKPGINRCAVNRFPWPVNPIQIKELAERAAS